jgi:hypothetical protein
MEHLLQKYRPAGPGGELRGRIVDAAQARSRGAFWEAMGVVLLVGMNLAVIGASVTRVLPTETPVDEAKAEELAAAIVALDLPVSREDAEAMAARLASGGRWVCVPEVHGNSKGMLTTIFGGMQ